MTTIAEQRAEAAGGDGQRFIAPDGREVTAIFSDDAITTWRDGRGTDVLAYKYVDGSAIVVAGDGWDIRANECEGYCWAGAGCRCEER